ncbi:MAG: nucleoside triphosphate pyrophosphatase [Planctomycetota bacterium]
MTDLPKLILASGSPQRLRLLAEAGYPFEVSKPDESAECGVCSTGGPAALVAELALRKAADVAPRYAGQNAVLLACDTVAECRGVILGKPKNEDHARQMLGALRGTVHRVFSGVCVWPIDRPDGVASRVVVSELQMTELSDDAIEDYLETGLWRGKAGSFGLQDRPDWLKVVSGSESNVIGLPMDEVAELLGAPENFVA